MRLTYVLCSIFLGLSLFGNVNVTFASEYEDNNIYIISTFDNKLPDDIKVNELYKGGHPNLVDYVFVETRVANLREEPHTNSKVLKKYGYGTKLQVLEKVIFNYNKWYKVKDEDGTIGYMSQNVSRLRTFRFRLAYEKILNLEKFISNSIKDGYELASTNTYVPNPNNENLVQDKDKYGTTADQNLKATAVKTGEKIYVPDRSIIKILEKGKKTSKVKALSIPEIVEIPNSVITKNPKIKADFSKVVAIDTKHQNVIVFQKNKLNEWEIISYVYSKTGITSSLGFETPKGYFSVNTAKYVMPYNDEGGQKQGQARYAIRFCGGGYIHGTPMNIQEEINREFYMKQKEKTLGTYSGTRKCVRTTEPHAKFLFDWIVPKKNKNSNAQRVDGDTYFIVF